MQVVEPEQPANLGELRIERPSETLLEALLEGLFDITGEAGSRELLPQLLVQALVLGGSGHRRGRNRGRRHRGHADERYRPRQRT
jgi:hypothetical protein